MQTLQRHQKGFSNGHRYELNDASPTPGSESKAQQRNSTEGCLHQRATASNASVAPASSYLQRNRQLLYFKITKKKIGHKKYLVFHLESSLHSQYILSINVSHKTDDDQPYITKE